MNGRLVGGLTLVVAAGVLLIACTNPFTKKTVAPAATVQSAAAPTRRQPHRLRHCQRSWPTISKTPRRCRPLECRSRKRTATQN
jgi:hypothetical protein